MKTKRIIAALCLTAAVSLANAQEYYDITSYYINNADFSANIDYDKDATGKAKIGSLKLPKGWSSSDDTLSGLVNATFAYGSQATISNVTVPAAGPDGNAEGSCYTLTNTYGSVITIYQAVKLPPGSYRLQVTYYNCNEKSSTVAENTSGWFVSANEHVYSPTLTFGTKEWATDVIPFTLTEATAGRLQIGIRCSGSATNSAILAIDNVKLLRDTPYGDSDVTGPVPTVTTDKRFARGATMAFARMKATISEGGIEEQGICWSENPEPTINDNTTTEYKEHSGRIYILSGLKPATVYYMRAYAKSDGRRVGYGEVIKFATVKKGNVTYTYNNGGDAAANERVNKAAQQACDIFNNLTEIVKKFNIGYSAGTPTADCYYADEPWMNMGANSSYQRTGTIMHEMQHGLGLVPYSTQWNKNILRERLDGEGRGTGRWLGDRVSEFLDFWDNTTGSYLNGDFQHMWPYGINGAQEDHNDIMDYYANAMIGQALGEDGLEHRSNTFAEPCYSFVQEDDVRYYLKNESEGRGLYSSYLMPTATGVLKWRTMTASQAQHNDSAAWYITFTPQNQYYQLRNAATGQYISYSAGVRTMARTTLTVNDNWHLMKGRVDVGSGSSAKRGYWFIHPTGNLTPTAIQANVNEAVGTGTFDIKNTATQQRWLILTAQETEEQESASMVYLRNEAAALLEKIKALADVPHTETAEGTDRAFADAIGRIAQRLNLDDITMLIAVKDEAMAAAKEFLGNVVAKDEPFDLTFMLSNPGMDTKDGWSVEPTVSYSCAEFFEKSFDFNQTVKDLPAGDYELKMQGFQRPGTSAAACNDYAAGVNNVNAMLYAGSKSHTIAHIATDAQTVNLGGTSVNGKYIPNTMEQASKYFAKGLYDNSLSTTVADGASSLKIGLRSTSMPASYWCIFDNFRLFYYGKLLKSDIDRDGTVTIADATCLAEMVANGSTDARADVNGDGKVDVADIIALLNILK